MHKLLLLLLLLLSTSLTFSQGYLMKIHLKDGSHQNILVNDVQRITFLFKPIPDDIGKIKINNAVQTCRLLQNYPNPFNQQTTIQYEIASKGDVQVKILDLNGKLVKSIENSMQEQGLHQLEWDGRNGSGNLMPGGIYIYQVVYQNSVVARRMLFIK